METAINIGLSVKLLDKKSMMNLHRLKVESEEEIENEFKQFELLIVEQQI